MVLDELYMSIINEFIVLHIYLIYVMTMIVWICHSMVDIRTYFINNINKNFLKHIKLKSKFKQSMLVI